MPDSGSILNDIKKVLGIEPDYTEFDIDVVMNINTSLATLIQVGVGPSTGYVISDDTATWSDFTEDIVLLAALKSYIYMDVRLRFDPPATSFAIESMQKQVDQLLWRLNVAVEALHPPTNPYVTV